MNLVARHFDDYEEGLEESEKAEFNAIRQNMEIILKRAASEEDAKTQIRESLPKNRIFLGPLMIFNEKYRSAQVQTEVDGKGLVDIDAHYYPES